MVDEFIAFSRNRVPENWWPRVRWLAPLACLLLVPLGMPILDLLRLAGWVGAPRAIQGLMLLAIVAGPSIGLLVLITVRRAGLDPRTEKLALLLARFAITGPLLTVVLVFSFTRWFYGD